MILLNFLGNLFVFLNPQSQNNLLIKEALRMEGARPSLMELLKKAEKADNSKPESADTETEAVELGDEGMPDSNSDFMSKGVKALWW